MAHTAQRDPRAAEIESRACRYGLPAVRWPPDWPLNTLVAMRSCVWAQEQGELDRFVHAAYTHEFAQGQDISHPDALAAIAEEVGLSGDDESRPVQQRLRELTDAAWERGVRGIPTIAVGSTLLYRDDQLEQIPLLLST